MIASARVRPCRSATWSTDPADIGDLTVFTQQDRTEIWNQLFQCALDVRTVRLQFNDPQDDDVITMIALDLRAEGWVATGIRTGSDNPIEHCVDRITHVEVLNELSSETCETPVLPPMA